MKDLFAIPCSPVLYLRNFITSLSQKQSLVYSSSSVLLLLLLQRPPSQSSPLYSPIVSSRLSASHRHRTESDRPTCSLQLQGAGCWGAGWGGGLGWGVGSAQYSSVLCSVSSLSLFSAGWPTGGAGVDRGPCSSWFRFVAAACCSAVAACLACTSQYDSPTRSSTHFVRSHCSQSVLLCSVQLNQLVRESETTSCLRV